MNDFEKILETEHCDINLFSNGDVAIVPKGYVCIPELIYRHYQEIEKHFSVKLADELFAALSNLNTVEELIYVKKLRENLFLDAKMNFADYIEDKDYVLSDEDYWRMVDMYEKAEDQNNAPYDTWLWVIEEFLKSKHENFYITFGSWKGFPYQDTYLIVKAKDSDEAKAKFRLKYPDKNPNAFCFSEMYSEEEWFENAISTDFKNKKPVDIIS